MAEITQAQSGPASDSATWVGGVAPGINDTLAPTAFDLIVDINLDFGNEAVTALDFSGVLTVNVGSTINVRGGVIQQGASTCNVYGTAIVDPLGAATHLWESAASGAELNIIGVPGVPAVFKGGTRGGLARLATDSFSILNNFKFEYCEFHSLGDSSNFGIVFAQDSVQEIMSNVLVNNCGTVHVYYSDASNDYDIDKLDIRNGLASDLARWQSYSLAVGEEPTGIKTITNSTFISLGSKKEMKNFTYGLLTEDCVFYNCSLSHTGRYQKTNRNLFISDEAATSIMAVGSYNEGTHTNNIFLTYILNPHVISMAGGPTGVGATTVRGIIFDGDGWATGDPGDLFFPGDVGKISHSIAINNAGNISLSIGTGCRLTVENTTSVNSGEGVAIESNTSADNLQSIRNNLFVDLPSGITQRSGPYSPQNSLLADNNCYYNMANALNLTHPINADRSYIGPEIEDSWWATGTFDGTTGRGSADVSIDPQLVDPTRTTRTWYVSVLGAGFAAATLETLADQSCRVNGYDKDGNAVTPVTGLDTDAALTYIRDGFTPQAVELQGAGYDGSDIGAVSVVLATHDVTVANDGNGTTIPEGVQAVTEGDDLPIAATPSLGYDFLNWTVTGELTVDDPNSASTQVSNVTGPGTVTANFEIQTFAVDYDTDGNGTISGDANQVIDYGSNGTEVVATPDTGYLFDSWSDAHPTANRTPQNVTGDIDEIASFVAISLVANDDSIIVARSGTITTLVGGASSVLDNDTDPKEIGLTAVLDDDVSNGSLTLNANGTFSYTHDGSVNLTDSFTYHTTDSIDDSNIATVSITITNSAPTVVDGVLTLSIGDTATELDNGNTSVLDDSSDPEDDTLTAILETDVLNGSLTLNPDGTFSYTHDGGVSLSDSFTFYGNDGIVNSNLGTINITITPAVITYDVTVANDGNGTTVPEGVNEVDTGSNLAIAATPSVGYEFDTWEATGGLTVDSPNSASTQISNITEDGTVTANFRLIGTEHDVTVSAGVGGTVSPSGTVVVEDGDNLAIIATPEPGYRFKMWKEIIA